MAPEVRLIALDIAVVCREIHPNVDHVIRRKRRVNGQVVVGDIIDGRARHSASAPELCAVLVKGRDHLGRYRRVGLEPQREA